MRYSVSPRMRRPGHRVNGPGLGRTQARCPTAMKANGWWESCPCGETFYMRPSQVGRKRYCSKPCLYKYRQSKLPSNHKGDAVGYDALHNWVKRHKGRPGPVCVECGSDGSGTRLEWANKSHEYHRVLDDWMPLCVRCHRRYDRAHDGPTVRERFPEIAGQQERRKARKAAK